MVIPEVEQDSKDEALSLIEVETGEAGDGDGVSESAIGFATVQDDVGSA